MSAMTQSEQWQEQPVTAHSPSSIEHINDILNSPFGNVLDEVLLSIGVLFIFFASDGLVFEFHPE
jgi:hypothetical protein